MKSILHPFVTTRRINNFLLVAGMVLCIPGLSIAQLDTTQLETKKKQMSQPDSLLKEHSPKKAARLSAILPGLGQAYNKKYWKIPVVYAALGTSTYFIVDNNNKYQKYRKAYVARTDSDSTTTTKIKFSTENIKIRRDFYRRNLELSIIITAGIYLLNIVDASVDAHLYYFDVSDDLSMKIEPQMRAFSPAGMRGGLKISLFF